MIRADVADCIRRLTTAEAIPEPIPSNAVAAAALFGTGERFFPGATGTVGRQRFLRFCLSFVANADQASAVGGQFSDPAA